MDRQIESVKIANDVIKLLQRVPCCLCPYYANTEKRCRVGVKYRHKCNAHNLLEAQFRRLEVIKQ